LIKKISPIPITARMIKLIINPECSFSISLSPSLHIYTNPYYFIPLFS
jgi:hypothetical protein